MRRARAEGDCARAKSRILNPRGVGHAGRKGQSSILQAAGEGDFGVLPRRGGVSRAAASHAPEAVISSQQYRANHLTSTSLLFRAVK